MERRRGGEPPTEAHKYADRNPQTPPQHGGKIWHPAQSYIASFVSSFCTVQGRHHIRNTVLRWLGKGVGWEKKRVLEVVFCGFKLYLNISIYNLNMSSITLIKLFWLNVFEIYPHQRGALVHLF